MDTGRLFVVDYEELKDIEAGVHPDQPKYIYSPVVYLALPKGKDDIEAIAVQYGQDINTPIATPQSGRWDWLAAKVMSKVATINHHEYLTHLGLTHLLIDPIVVATYRNLPPQHPLNPLLLPHFEGTLPINALGVKKLLFREGTMDRTFAGKFEDAFGMLSKVRNEFNFRENFLPKHVARRGLVKTAP